MIDFNTLHRSNIDNRFYAENDGEKVEIKDCFPIEEWDSVDAFNSANIRGYEPMTAKELETEEEQDKCLNDKAYFIEEKFDGTRAIVQFFSQKTVDDEEVGYARVFSRRISKKTGFYVENTDSVPQIREINVPEMKDTILDGEMFINGRPFKDVSSTLNCLWDKAIDRQIELGFISLHAFDILKYKGIDLRNMKLEKRKHYLHLAITEINSPYIEEVAYQECGGRVSVEKYEKTHGKIKDVYDKLVKHNKEEEYPHFCLEVEDKRKADKFLSPRAFYEYIVCTGGEGLIVKPKNGTYKHKRGWEYSKIKKFLTREMILIKFDEPTKEYQGKAPNNWAYYEDGIPVTKFYYNKQVGNMILGVLITDAEFNSLKKDKQGNIYTPSSLNLDPTLDKNYKVMEVCECGGYNDEERAYFTKKKSSYVGKVVEVKANEIMKDSGRLRHPRYLRMRFDKEPNRCIWEDHIGG